MNRFISLSVVFFTTVGFASQVAPEQDKSPKTASSLHVLQSVRNLPHDPFVRVLLGSQKNSFQVEVKGAHNVYDPFSGKKIEAAFLSSSYQMTPTPDGIKWGQEFPGVYQILIVPDSKSGTVIVDGIQYPGAVAFYEVGSNLAAVNWVSLEEFTSSLLSMMMAPVSSDQKEALAAMAIGVRSLAHEQLLHSANNFWDVRADGCGYKGLAVIRQDEPFREAIQITKDLILEPRPEGSAGLSANELEKLKNGLNYQQSVEFAQNGKDAAYILQKTFPGRSLQNVHQK